MKLEAEVGASHVERFDPEMMEFVQIPIAVAPKMQRRAGKFTTQDAPMNQRTPDKPPVIKNEDGPNPLCPTVVPNPHAQGSAPAHFPIPHGSERGGVGQGQEPGDAAVQNVGVSILVESPPADPQDVPAAQPSPVPAAQASPVDSSQSQETQPAVDPLQPAATSQLQHPPVMHPPPGFPLLASQQQQHVNGAGAAAPATPNVEILKNLDSPFEVPHMNQSQLAADPFLNADMNQVPTPAREQTVLAASNSATKPVTSHAFDHSATNTTFAQNQAVHPQQNLQAAFAQVATAPAYGALTLPAQRLQSPQAFPQVATGPAQPQQWQDPRTPQAQVQPQNFLAHWSSQGEPPPPYPVGAASSSFNTRQPSPQHPFLFGQEGGHPQQQQALSGAQHAQGVQQLHGTGAQVDQGVRQPLTTNPNQQHAVTGPMDMATFQQQFLTAMNSIAQLTAKVDQIPTRTEFEQHIVPLQREQAQQSQRVAQLEHRHTTVRQELGQLVRLTDKNDRSYEEAILLQTPAGVDPDTIYANVSNFMRTHFAAESAQVYNEYKGPKDAQEYKGTKVRFLCTRNRDRFLAMLPQKARELEDSGVKGTWKKAKSKAQLQRGWAIRHACELINKHPAARGGPPATVNWMVGQGVRQVEFKNVVVFKQDPTDIHGTFMGDFADIRLC